MIAETAPDTAPAAGVCVQLEASDRLDLDVSRGLTPQRVDQILTAANNGDTAEQARLSVEIEEKSWDIGQALGTRRAAVSGLPWTIEAPEGMESDDAATAVAADLKAALDDAGDDELLSFPQLLSRSLLKALVPGAAVAEIVWCDGGAGFEGFQDIPAHALTFRDGARRPLLVTRDTPIGVPLAARKFICHLTPGASGDPARGGLVRPLAWLYCFANLNVKDLLTFIERYGMPFLLARVDASAYDVEKNRLAALIRNFGSAGGAVFTKSVEANLLQGQMGASDVYFKLLDYLGAAVQKVVQGQTATSGAASGWSQGGAQAAVRQDILESDCAALAATLRRELFTPWTAYNAGPAAPVPRIVFHCEPPADKKALAETLATLSSAGLEVEDPAEVSAVVGIKLQRKPAAQAGDTVTDLAGAASEAPAASEIAGVDLTKTALNGAQVTALVDILKSAAIGEIPERSVLPLFRAAFPSVPEETLLKLAASIKGFTPATPSLALGAESAAVPTDLSTKIADELGVPAGWLEPVAKLLQEIEAKAADTALSDADLLAFAESAVAQIPELFKGMDIDALADVFEKAMGGAAIEGARAGMRRTAAAKAGSTAA